jgi:hypothetical protein
MRATRNAYRILVGKPEGKRHSGTPRNSWEDIRMDIGEIGWKVVDWIHLGSGYEPVSDRCEHRNEF